MLLSTIIKSQPGDFKVEIFNSSGMNRPSVCSLIISL